MWKGYPCSEKGSDAHHYTSLFFVSLPSFLQIKDSFIQVGEREKLLEWSDPKAMVISLLQALWGGGVVFLPRNINIAPFLVLTKAKIKDKDRVGLGSIAIPQTEACFLT